MSDTPHAVTRQVRTPGRSVPTLPPERGGEWQRTHVPPGGDRKPKKRLSLAVRLPLFLLVSLALVVILFGFAAYRTVRENAIELAMSRMSTAARELAANSGRSTATRFGGLMDLANRTVVRQALTGDPSAVAQLDSVLRDRQRPNDSSLLGWDLRTASGVQRYSSLPESADTTDAAVLARITSQALEGGSLQASPLFNADSQVHVWVSLPVRSEDAVVGVLSELRRITGTAQAEATIRGLTGNDVRVMFSSIGSNDWSSVRGTPIGAPFLPRERDDVSVRVEDSPDGRMYVAHARVGETPWLIVLAQPESAVLAGPSAFLARLLAVGSVLLVLGTLGAWWLGRREARPLVQLQEAAEAMARGEYRQFVPPSGGAEMSALTDTFNSMATRIADAHAVLEHQNIALQRANDAKARFLAVMSHELRTPLNAIGGFTDLMLLGVRGPTTAAQVEDLERIQRNKDQLLHIVTDILHYSRLHANQNSTHAQVVQLDEELRDLERVFRPQFDKKQVQLTIGNTDAQVSADVDCTRKIIEHLLSNALKFTPRGGEVRVETETPLGDFQDELVRLRISDTGIGMSHEAQATIFQPFVQLDDSLTRRAGGTGLGLAMVKELTIAMGGTVEVESEPGKGSTFTLTLPAAAGVPA